ncbi:transportin-3 [Neocloeon triangulifer]|uniref:transportin-3 n=1 Tax=Neocloeon triangulifer TaxID=2078957 RepID=UPI00286F3089|nr:transportin-3 [Neocloeon triangulifer]
MQAAPSLENVYGAVSTLFGNQDTSQREKASAWLDELQKSVYAWKIADAMLHEKKDLESCYFAAQTMRTKVQLNFNELPKESHESLRDSLMEHIGQVTDQTNVVIVTQLCLAMADLALQMNSWHNPIEDLIHKYSQTNVWPLLEILTVLPEEVNSRLLRLGANRRNEVTQELASHSKIVLEYLKACLVQGANNQQLSIKILKCFTSWISIQAITLADIPDNPIVSHAFTILLSHEAPFAMHDCATDCICALLQHLEDNNNQQELEVQIVDAVVRLESSYHMTVAEESTEKSLNYCRIFTELSEAMLDKIINGSSAGKPHFAVNTFDLVLTCVGHHDYEVAEITFNLWYRLSELLYVKNQEDLSAIFVPHVERLIVALCRHCQIEPDHEGLIAAGEDFSSFRTKVSELIKDMVFIIGSSHCFRQMFLQLQSPGMTWDVTEAALFIMQAVAKNILPEEDSVVPKVMEAILTMPPDAHIMVRHTAVVLLGELCEWIERHHESLEPVLNYLLVCLQHPLLGSAAANALQNICSACRDHMSVHLRGLLEIVRSMSTFKISNEAAIGLLKGVSIIVGRLPGEQIDVALREICNCQLMPLCLLIEGDVKIEKGTQSDPVLWLDRLSAILRHTNPLIENPNAVHPCLGVVAEVFPVLSKALGKYQDSLRIMERCCRCIRFGIRCVGKQAGHLLEPLVKQIVTMYALHKHSCFLYLGSILVDEFATEANCVQGLLGMLQAFVEPAFELMRSSGGLKNNPDTVDDFFRLCVRFLQRTPVPLLQSNILNAVMDCALMASTLDHKDANSSVMNFFFNLVHCGRNGEDKPDFKLRQQLVKHIMESSGQVLVLNLINSSIFCLHSNMLGTVAEVIFEMMLFNRAEMCVWLEHALKSLPTTNAGGHVNATQKQLVDFHKLVTRAEHKKEVTHALRDFAHLFH